MELIAYFVYSHVGTSILNRSNFQFIWPWEEWAYVLDLPKWAPKRVFVQEVLQREVRLSYWDKIKQVTDHLPDIKFSFFVMIIYIL